MLPLEGWGVRLVAVGAKGGHPRFQEGIGSRGGVRSVAAEAPLFHRLVPELALCDRLRDVLMTIEAELLPGQEQVVLVFRRMGVVALHALPFRGRLVDALRLPGDDPRVALQADPVGVLRQELPLGGGMGIVAVGAVSLLHRSVDEGKPHLLLERRVAVEADLPARARLQAKLVLGKRQRGREKRRDAEEQQDDPVTRLHTFSFIAFVRCGTLRSSGRRTGRGASP